MRFMVIVKASKSSEAGVLPSQKLLEEMGKFNEELVKAGIMLAGEGLQASAKGARVQFSGKKRTVIDGPFTETKELIAGFWIGDSPIFLVDEMPEWGALGPKSLKGSPVTVHLFVPDADAFVARAVAAGAKVTMPLADMFWGDRYGKLEDPFGHHWAVATHKRDLTPAEIAEAAAKFC